MIGNKNIIAFILGFTSFYAFSLLSRYVYVNNKQEDSHFFAPKSPHSNEDQFKKYQGKHIDELSKHEIIWPDEHSSSHDEEDIVAKILAKKVRIFCWIMTMSKDHEIKARHIKATWAKRCNNYIFMSNANDTNLPAINANVTDGRDHLWQKTKNSLLYLYKHHLNNYDYFLKADDDTFVIVENLRHMVKSYNPNEAFYLGRRFKPYVKQGYMSGGAGYLMSRGALKSVIENGINKSNVCPKGESGAEDVNIGACLEAIGVKIIDSLDEEKRERFHPLPPATMILESHMKSVSWMYSYNYHKLKFGSNCCSDDSATFHYIAPHDMYVIEFFVYHLRPYGIIRDYKELNGILSQKKLRSKLLEEKSQLS